MVSQIALSILQLNLDLPSIRFSCSSVWIALSLPVSTARSLWGFFFTGVQPSFPLLCLIHAGWTPHSEQFHLRVATIMLHFVYMWPGLVCTLLACPSAHTSISGSHRFSISWVQSVLVCTFQVTAGVVKGQPLQLTVAELGKIFSWLQILRVQRSMKWMLILKAVNSIFGYLLLPLSCPPSFSL